MVKMEKEEPNSSKPIVVSSTTTTSGLGGDRLKRDEWSEGAVSCLLDTYESKWVLRNRAKLKGHDWEDVARHVSSRANSTKAPKTQTQCKNKIESMKKRYRSESSSTDPSLWPLFQRLDVLLRCRTTDNYPTASTVTATIINAPPLLLLDPPASPQPPAPLPPPSVPSHSLPHPNIGGGCFDSHESNDAAREESKEEEDLRAKKIVENGFAKTSMETGSTSGSTPVSETIKEKLKMKKTKLEKNKKKWNKRRGRGKDWEVAKSIRWLAEVVMRSEQTRMETMKEVEIMRMEAEAKKTEMDLKRTEIMANTQLQIAKILASNSKDIDSSLRIGRS